MKSIGVASCSKSIGSATGSGRGAADMIMGVKWVELGGVAS